MTVELLRIRRYADTDRDAVWALHNLALDLVDAHAGNGPWDDDLHHIEDVYIRPGGEFLVGATSAGLVAMGALLLHRGGTSEIKRMRVHPSVQRQGYGTAILEALERAARAAGCTRLILDTTTRQTGANRLYRKHGYLAERQSEMGPFTLNHYAKALTA